MTFEVREGDCVELMAAMPAGSVDAVVCDPPYALNFMGKDWDRFAGYVERNGSSRALGDDGGRHDEGYRNMQGRQHEFQQWCQAWATEALRVLKPGGHLLAFGGTRTYHRLVCAVEDAGFEIRDTISWLYGSGFPKSLNVGAAIDKRRDDEADVRVVCRFLRESIDVSPYSVANLAERFGFHARMVEHWAARDTDSQPTLPTLEQWDELRDLLGFDASMDAEVLRLNLRKGEPGEAWADRPVTGQVAEWKDRSNYALASRDGLRRDIPATPEAERWEGWGTALKPAHEPVVVARKPLSGTVAGNVLEHGTGALNVDGCRVAGATGDGHWRSAGGGYMEGWDSEVVEHEPPAGRWPANCVLSHSEDCVVSSGQRPSMDEWEDVPSLCDSCAVDAGETLRRTAPGTLASTATSNAEPTTSAKDETPPSGTSKTATGCSVGTLVEGQLSDPTAASSSSTGVSGRTPTDPSPTDSSSTTSMGSAPIIGSRTCRLCGAEITTPSTTRAFLSDRDSRGCVSSCPVRLLDEQTGELTSGAWNGVVNQARMEQISKGAERERLREDRASDSGGASRFFPTFKHDTLCALCNLPCVGSAANPSLRSEPASDSAPDVAQASPSQSSGDSSEPSLTSATPAESGSRTTPATAHDGSAPTDAQQKLGEWIAQLAGSAEPLCKSCETSTAQSVALWLTDPTQASQVGWGSTSERNVRILSRDLALVAAGSQSTGTTPTTATLSALCGSAVAATQQSIPTAGTENDPDRMRLQYCPKSSRAERNAGLEGFEQVEIEGDVSLRSQGVHGQTGKPNKPILSRNHHPTVKPIGLMRWLVRLVTPPGGTICDPFTGSGTTGIASVLEGFDFIGLEREPEYVDIARARIGWWHKHRGDGEAAQILAAGELRDEVEATGQLGMFD